MAGNTATRVLPFLIFPVISALAVKFIIGHIHESKLANKLNSHCGIPFHDYSDFLSSTNFLRPYTGILTTLDKSVACGYVVFFHAVIDSPKSLPTTIEYFTTAVAPYALMTIIEGNRKGQKGLFRFPVVPLLLTQFGSFGMTFPLSCLFLVVTGGVERARQSPARSFSRLQAESIAFAMIIGLAIPSVAMSILDHPFVTWLWQFFPVYLSISQNLYLYFRSPSRSATSISSGYSTMRFLYITTLLLSACSYLNVVWKQNLRNNFFGVVQSLYPSTQVPDPAVDIDLQTLHILKWDFTLGYTAACIALFWYARNWHLILVILVWYALAVPLLGIGTAFMGVAIWRDAILW